MFDNFSLTDIVLFIGGFVFGTAISYGVGKLVFAIFFKREAKAITVESTAYFESIQQVISYLLGFAMGSALIAPELFLPIFATWLAAQTFLALKIFGFRDVHHGFIFSLIDSLADTIVGATFGTGTAAYTLIRLTLLR